MCGVRSAALAAVLIPPRPPFDCQIADDPDHVSVHEFLRKPLCEFQDAKSNVYSESPPIAPHDIPFPGAVHAPLRELNDTGNNPDDTDENELD